MIPGVLLILCLFELKRFNEKKAKVIVLEKMSQKKKDLHNGDIPRARALPGRYWDHRGWKHVRKIPLCREAGQVELSMLVDTMKDNQGKRAEQKGEVLTSCEIWVRYVETGPRGQRRVGAKFGEDAGKR